ncbi:AI-2E family transporter [Paenibacillus oenotherae]|uniref:AI-2E family transporter n=1 Tax=Paenibacillus oenotherae TaxID=1435645 RepID=UPI001FE933A4|nr:AI-2E family transporter [Paenibacillus oenotherae]
MPQSRLFRTCMTITVMLLIIFLLSKVSFLFQPIKAMFHLLIVPFMLAGFFYYLMRPIVQYLVHRKVNRIAAILLIYLAMAAVVTLFAIVVWPALMKQIHTFAEGAPAFIESFREQIERLQHNRLVAMFSPDQSDLSTKLSEYLDQAITAASDYVSNFIAAVTNFFIVVATAPIILYYMLKEGESIPRSVLHLIPRRYNKDGQEVLEEIDGALSGFIIGRVIITFLLGVMMYAGFMLIGLPYALLVTVIATVLNIIPYIGPILGAIPCIIVAFIDSPAMVIWVIIVTIVTQQIEGNLLSPHIYGKRLDIHPLTTILLMLIAGELWGIVGVILAIPIYMVLKIIIVRLYTLFLAEKVEELVE